MNQRDDKLPHSHSPDDLLGRAVDALRAEVDADDYKLSRETRAKLLQRSTPQRLAARRLAWAGAIVAFIGVPMAWAAATGRLVPAVDAIARAWHGVAADDDGAKAPVVVANEPLAAVQPAVKSAVPNANTSAPPDESPRTTMRVAADRGQVLFRKAHELHFRGGDPAAAIAAWDKYLAFAPNGAFVLEARYNRALALIRVGRTAEAVTALRPYAEGKVMPQAYRQSEATQLIELLQKKMAPAADFIEHPAP